MWELDHKEGWALKKLCFQTVVLEKTLESPLDCKEIQPVHPKGNQSWIFIGRTDAEVETLILWPPDVKSRLTRKDPDAGKDWRQKKGMTEDEMVWWHHWFNGYEFGQAAGDGEGQGSLECYSPWGHTESDTTEATQQQQQSRLWFSQWSCMDVRVGLWRKLSAKKLMLLNCSVGEDSWESLGLQGDPTSPS